MYKRGGSQVHLTRIEDVKTSVRAAPRRARAPACRRPRSRERRPWNRAPCHPRVRRGPARRRRAGRDHRRDLGRGVGRGASPPRAGVAHGRLNAGHVVVTGQGPAIVDLVDASYGATEGRRRADIAELLVSVAMVIGNERAVTTAFASLGADTLAGALPFLQSPALSAEERPRLPHDRKALQHRLADLRSLVASTAGVDEPALQQLYRVNATNFLMAVGSLVAVPRCSARSAIRASSGAPSRPPIGGGCSWPSCCRLRPASRPP